MLFKWALADSMKLQVITSLVYRLQGYDYSFCLSLFFFSVSLRL